MLKFQISPATLGLVFAKLAAYAPAEDLRRIMNEVLKENNLDAQLLQILNAFYEEAKKLDELSDNDPA